MLYCERETPSELGSKREAPNCKSIMGFKTNENEVAVSKTNCFNKLFFSRNMFLNSGIIQMKIDKIAALNGTFIISFKSFMKELHAESDSISYFFS